MSRARMIAVHALIAAITIGSLVPIVSGRDAWPFSNYPMYAELVHGRCTWFWLYGESAAGEIPLHEWNYWHPAGEQRLALGLRVLTDRPNGGRVIRDALGKLATRYESARRAGRHDGPELRALRVYEVSWDVARRGPGRRPPERRVLLGEAKLDAPH